jgi:hypothetical protein
MLCKVLQFLCARAEPSQNIHISSRLKQFWNDQAALLTTLSVPVCYCGSQLVLVGSLVPAHVSDLLLVDIWNEARWPAWCFDLPVCTQGTRQTERFAFARISHLHWAMEGNKKIAPRLVRPVR